MIKALIIDLDGTVLPARQRAISPGNLDALHRAARRGLTRVLATGRSPRSLLRALPGGLPVDYIVFSSGAGILRCSDNAILYRRELTLADTLHVASILWPHDINFTIQAHIPHNHRFLYREASTPHEDFRRRIQDYPGQGLPIHSLSDIRDGGTQFLAILDARQLPLHHHLRAALASYSVIRATSPVDHQAIWTEIFAPGVNKGTSCQWLLHHLGLTFAECAGLGNDYNDVDFLTRCAHPAVVANAPDDLRRRFPVVPADTLDGLAHFIRHLP